jgi:hypothetical protein
MKTLFDTGRRWLEKFWFLAEGVVWGARWLTSGAEDMEGQVRIMGSQDFVGHCLEALGLLGQHAPDAYALVQQNLTRIVEWRRSLFLRGMALLGPQARRGAPELAGYIAYAAFHSGALQRRGAPGSSDVEHQRQVELKAEEFTRSVMAKLDTASASAAEQTYRH